MLRLIAALVGLYVLVGLAVAAGGVYGLINHTPTRSYDCMDNDLAVASGAAPRGTTGSPNPVKEMAIRAAVWPYSAWTALRERVSLADWFVLRYDYAPDACHGGEMMVPYPPTARG